MSNNAPDYENNLVFPPQEEGIEQKLAHSEKMRDYTAEYVAKLEEKLKIAEEALHIYANLLYDVSVKGYESIAKEALAKIDEQQMKTTCDICGKEIIGIENFVDAGDKVVCSQKCLETAIAEFYHWQNTKG